MGGTAGLIFSVVSAAATVGSSVLQGYQRQQSAEAQARYTQQAAANQVAYNTAMAAQERQYAADRAQQMKEYGAEEAARLKGRMKTLFAAAGVEEPMDTVGAQTWDVLDYWNKEISATITGGERRAQAYQYDPGPTQMQAQAQLTAGSSSPFGGIMSGFMRGAQMAYGGWKDYQQDKWYRSQLQSWKG